MRKRCSNITSITITLQGVVSNITTDTTGLIGASPTWVLSRNVVLFDSGPHKSAVLDGEEYLFLIPFPTCVTRGDSPLPPAYAVVHYGAYCHIKYHVNVDIVRKGLYRHERVSIPISYLPRSRPSLPPLLDLVPRYSFENTTDNERIGSVELTASTIREDASKAFLACSAYLTMPSPSRFAAGEIIPLAVTISCQKNPCLPGYLITSNCLIIEFVKLSKIWSTSGWNVKETVPYSAILQRVVNDVEGVNVSYWSLQAGCSQEQMSCYIHGALEISFMIRVYLKLPRNVAIKLRSWKHDEPVTITTDPWIDPVLAEETMDHPALRLDDLNFDKEVLDFGL